MKNEILTITSYSKKGRGQANQISGRGVEVIGSVVGDEVTAMPLKKKKGKMLSKLLEVKKSSESRVPLKCMHAPSCGGCTFQQVSYQSQLEHKQEVIQNLFSPLTPHSIEKISPSPTIWEYRNKMEFTFSQNNEEEKFLGLILGGSRGYVFHLKECHLTSSFFKDTIQRVRKWWESSSLKAYHARRDTGSLQTLTLREGTKSKDQMVILTVSGNSDYALSKDDIDSFKKAVGETPSIFMTLKQVHKGQRTQFFEMHLQGKDVIRDTLLVNDQEFLFDISPASFFQPNTLGAEKMFETALQNVTLSKDMVVYDLCCGAGAIGMIFASYVKKVIGIEVNRFAVLDGRENLKLNNILNMEILEEDVQTYTYSEAADLVIIDPPRAGLLEKALKQLLIIAPKEILYVSCNPYSQRDNVTFLVENGYEIKKVLPFDQFPHTPHIENIVVLRKK